MKLFSKDLNSYQSELDAPPSPHLWIFRILFVVLLFSFVFDYKAPDLGFGSAQTGGSAAQYLFLAIAMGAGGLLSVLGIRYLLIRPGVYMVLLWWGYVLFMVGVAFLSGNEVGRILRLLIPNLLVGLSINAVLICAGNGMRPGEAVRWFLIAGVVNLFWRFGFGVFGTGLGISNVRMEVLSPSMRFLFAWAGCALVLRHKFSWWSLVILGLPLAVAAISVTRSMALPFGISFIMAAFCLALAIMWKMHDLSFPFKKMVPLAAMGGIAIFVLCGTLIAVPSLAERWTERLFDNKGQGGAVTEDLSSLMRKAEALSMINILKKDPHCFIYGKGLGAAYYWDEAYYPELFLVYPEDRHQFPFEITSAGHSVWTYCLFSSGGIGVICVLTAFFAPMFLSLQSARLISKTVMGPRAWDSFLMYLPFVAMWATLSESITRNPFDERFTGVLFGFMIAMPQFFYNRAFYLSYRERLSQDSSQLIIDESLAPREYEAHTAPPAQSAVEPVHNQAQGGY